MAEALIGLLVAGYILFFTGLIEVIEHYFVKRPVFGKAARLALGLIIVITTLISLVRL